MYPILMLIGIGLFLYFWETYSLKKKKLERDSQIAKILGSFCFVAAVVYFIYWIIRR